VPHQEKGKRGGPPSGGSFQARHLNLQLEQKTDIQDLLAVVGQHVDDFNVVNCATALNR
jgi:hypothetical protein